MAKVKKESEHCTHQGMATRESNNVLVREAHVFNKYLPQMIISFNRSTRVNDQENITFDQG